MPIAYSYKRVSSKRQVQGHGPDRQQDAAEEYAALHGLVLDDTYHDLGRSAYHSKHLETGALGAFLEEVSAGRIQRGSYLLVENLDRLSRDKVRKAMPVFLEIINAGIKIVTLLDNPPQVYSAEKIDEDNGMSLFGSMMVMVRAHDESKSKGKRVKQAWDKKRDSGSPMTAICPKWLRLSEDRTKYIKIPEKVETVQRIFKMSLEDGYGVHAITKLFNGTGVACIGDAKNWEASAVARILHNKAVIGTMVSPRTGIESPNYYPPIIDVKDFERTQSQIKVRANQGQGRKGQNVANLFSGMCRCGLCGSRMRFTTKGQHCYLHCLGSYEGTKTCNAPRLNYGPIEHSVLTNIFAIEHAPIVDGVASIDPLIGYRDELADLNAKMERYLDEFDDADDEIVKRHVRQRMKRMGEQIANLEEKIKTFVPAPPIAEEYERAKVIYDEHENFRVRHEGGEDLSAAYREVRLRLQATLQRVIEKISLHPQITKTEIGGKPAYSRKYTIYGSLVKLQEGSERLFSFIEKTQDGGLSFTYFLPSWGLNNSGREAEYMRQLGSASNDDKEHDELLREMADVRNEIIAEIRKIPESERTAEMVELLAEHERLVRVVSDALDVISENIDRSR